MIVSHNMHNAEIHGKNKLYTKKREEVKNSIFFSYFTLDKNAKLLWLCNKSFSCFSSYCLKLDFGEAYQCFRAGAAAAVATMKKEIGEKRKSYATQRTNERQCSRIWKILHKIRSINKWFYAFKLQPSLDVQ